MCRDGECAPQTHGEVLTIKSRFDPGWRGSVTEYQPGRVNLSLADISLPTRSFLSKKQTKTFKKIKKIKKILKKIKRAALDWAPAPHSPVPQCQAHKAFAVPENNAMLPWDCIQGLVGTPDYDDHGLPTLGP